MPRSGRLSPPSPRVCIMPRSVHDAAVFWSHPCVKSWNALRKFCGAPIPFSSASPSFRQASGRFAVHAASHSWVAPAAQAETLSELGGAATAATPPEPVVPVVPVALAWLEGRVSPTGGASADADATAVVGLAL